MQFLSHDGFELAYLDRQPASGQGDPVLMIHGEGDTYIKPQMARDLVERIDSQKELWLIPKAKHNQCHLVAGEEYARRVVAFFDKYLATAKPLPLDLDIPRMAADASVSERVRVRD